MKAFIAFSSFLLLISLACSTSKSADSARVVNEGGSVPSASNTSANSTQDKQPCTLTLAPAIKRLHLGMTADEVLGLFPGSKDDQQIKSALSSPVDELGVSSFSLKPAKYGPPQGLSDVSGITFTLFDGRVFKMYIGYGGSNWPTVDKFVEDFVHDTDFPPSGEWQGYPGMENQMKVLQCSGFEARAFASARGAIMAYVEIRDLAAEKQMKDREEKLLQKRPS